jgi:DNA polymerase III epsilon subunit-like protein
MRDIIFDVETTGLRAKDGDRICEIAGIEMIDFVPTGVEFHEYVNPTIPMPAKAEEIHGLSDAFLKPTSRCSTRSRRNGSILLAMRASSRTTQCSTSVSSTPNWSAAALARCRLSA